MRTGSAISYRVFVRNWWRRAGSGDPQNHWREEIAVVPDPGARRTTIATHCTLKEAQAICAEYARTHKPGALSRKAEFERED